MQQCPLYNLCYLLCEHTACTEMGVAVCIFSVTYFQVAMDLYSVLWAAAVSSRESVMFLLDLSMRQGFGWMEGAWQLPCGHVLRVSRAVLQQGRQAGRSFNFGLSIPAGLHLCALKGYLGLVFHMFHFNEVWLCELETFGAFWNDEAVLPWDTGQVRSCNTWQSEEYVQQFRNSLLKKKGNGRKPAFGERSKQPKYLIPF